MSKTIKFIFVVLGVIVLLLVSGLIIVSITVNPNVFKPKITNLVKKHTGRDLKIDGDLGLSIFPNIELTVGKASLSNIKGFGEKPFLQINDAELGVELIPLLRKELKIQKVTLDGLRLNLSVKKNGKTNWDNFINQKSLKEEESIPKPKPATNKSLTATDKLKEPVKPKALLTGFGLGELALTDAKIEWHDRRTRKRMVIDQIEFTIGEVEPGVSTPLSFNLSLKGVESSKDSQVRVSSNMLLNKDINGLVLNELQFQIVGQKISGNIEINNFDKPQVVFKLDSTHLNFDHVNDVLTEFRKASENRKEDKSQKQKSDRRVESKTNEKVGATLGVAASAAAAEERLALDTLRDLDVNGTLNVDTIVMANLKLQEFSLNLRAKEGLIEVTPIKATAYTGEYDGKVVLDARGPKPIVTFTESLKGLQSEPFLTDLLKEPSRFTGMLNVSGTASADANVPLKTLNGSFKFEFLHGAVKDINITHMLRVARAKLKGEPTPSDEKRQTDFSSLTGTASINNGVVNNRDLLVKAPVLRVDGDGSANMLTENIDYLLMATLVNSLEGQGGRELKDLVGIPVPIRVSGSFDKPNYKVDMERLIKGSSKEAAKRKAKEKLQRKLEKKGLGDLLKF